MEWVGLLVLIVILGALAGGNSFGETIRKGAGCLLVLVLALFVIGFLVAVSQT